MYADVRIQELPLSLGRMRARMEAFLAENGLTPEPVDRYVVVTRGEEEEILAGGGLAGDVIKGVAVSERARGENLTGPLVTHLLGLAAAAGYDQVKVYTKPENETVFRSLGFHVIGRSPGILLLENGRGLETWCRRLAAAASPPPASGASGAEKAGRRETCGVIVMNADPMTLGHRYLVEQAAACTDRLYVLVLGGDRSRFSAAARFRIAETVCRAFGEKVRVLEGGEYCISPATFPSYFLKQKDEAAEQQMRLDLDLFARHVAPALGAGVRFVGSEPLDPMTARYNELMRDILPQHGLAVAEVPRLAAEDGPVSASAVRRRLDGLDLTGALRLCPPAALCFLLGDAAATALCRELEVPDKPGMVCPDSRGSHDDMDAALMRRSIAALRPWFVELGASAADGRSDGTLAERVRNLGLRAEEAMLRATGGVNTHRGALFALGLTVAAAGACLRDGGGLSADALQDRIRQLAGGLERLNGSGEASPQESTDRTSGEPGGARSETAHGAAVVRQYGVKGAFRMALDGYRDLFDDWLPYYRSVKNEAYGLPKTLLRIMSSLDDTCVIHRAGIGRAQAVKAEAAALLAGFGPEKLKEMNSRYVSERVSPGGSADMLALTILADALININLQH